MSSSSLGKRAATDAPPKDAGESKLSKAPKMTRASAVTRPVSPPVDTTTSSRFLDAQGGMAILLMASDHDSSTWYIVPQDIFCKDLQPIANKYRPDQYHPNDADNTECSKDTKDMMQYLADIDHIYPYEFPEGQEDGETSDDDKDEEKKEKHASVAKNKAPQWDPEEARQRESAELYALFEGPFAHKEAKWTKYRVSNTVTDIFQSKYDRMWASDIRIINAKCVFCMYANEC